MSLIYYFIDTETTGLSVDNNEINEISIMRQSDGKQYSTRVKVKNPDVFSPQALEVQGIRREDLLKGIPIEQAIEEVDAFMAEDGKTKAHRCLIAHNAPFDRKFVHRAWEEAAKEFMGDLWMDTMTFAKRWVKSSGLGPKIAKAQDEAGVMGIKEDKKTGRLKPKYGQNNLMLGAGLEPKLGAHSAEVDVQNLQMLYEFLIGTKTEYVSIIGRVPHKEDKKDVLLNDLDIDDF